MNDIKCWIIGLKIENYLGLLFYELEDYVFLSIFGKIIDLE